MAPMGPFNDLKIYLTKLSVVRGVGIIVLISQIKLRYRTKQLKYIFTFDLAPGLMIFYKLWFLLAHDASQYRIRSEVLINLI